MAQIVPTPAKPRGRIRTDGVVTKLPTVRQPSATYMRGEQLPTFAKWLPSLREANDDVRSAWRNATSRAVDLIQNSGWLSGAVEQAEANVVGSGLRLSCKPDHESLGWDPTTANEWARRVEARFSLWADSPRACDAEGRYTFGQLQGAAFRSWLMHGEALAAVTLKERPGSSWLTKLRLIPAVRLNSETDQMKGMDQGIILNDGEPVGYSISVDTGFGEEYRTFPARDQFGRPQIIHTFIGEPGQVRGITPFVSILKVAKQFDQLAGATLTSAIIQTIVAAMFKSQSPSDEVLASMQTTAEQAEALEPMLTSRADWYSQTDFNLGEPGRVLHGYPGDELQFFRSETPNSVYEHFAKFLLHEMSRATALTYEEFTGDYAGATFSSSKMGTAATWPRVIKRRDAVIVPFAQQVYEAWLEEEIDSGLTPFPNGLNGFYENKEAVCQSIWRGPAKPQPDELKAANAMLAYKEAGVPDSILFADLGHDIDDIYEMLAREKDRRKELGLETEMEMADEENPFGQEGEDEEPADDQQEDEE